MNTPLSMSIPTASYNSDPKKQTADVTEPMVVKVPDEKRHFEVRTNQHGVQFIAATGGKNIFQIAKAATKVRKQKAREERRIRKAQEAAAKFAAELAADAENPVEGKPIVAMLGTV